MARFDYDIGILGGGAAGLTVASGAAQLGARTLLVEKEPALGGDCLHFGCVPSKTLIRSARVYHYLKNTERLGLPKVAVPPVTFGDLKRRIQAVISDIQKHDSPERFCRLGVRVEFASPSFLDEHTISLDSGKVSARTWVLATGSSPSIPVIEGLKGIQCLTNRQLFSLNELPRSMIILGAGPVAVEMAQAFCRLGTRVAVVHRGGQILAREDKDMADLLMGTLESEGVVFYLNSTVAAVKDLGSGREVTVRTAGGPTIGLPGDQILIALGREANVQGLGLDHIGVHLTKKGVTVDSRLRTSHRHIYAAGDVTGEYQFTHAAGYEGGIVVSNAVIHYPRKVDYTNLPWCTYTDPELASIGMNELRARAAGVHYSVWEESFRNNDRSIAEGAAEGRVKLLLGSKGRPLGIQVLGPHAGEIIGEWVAALNGGVRLSTLASSVHPYPTLGEINKRVAGQYLSKKIFSDRVRRVLAFFFGYRGSACDPDPMSD